MVVVEEVVSDGGIDNSVTVNTRTSSHSVVVDNVIFNQGTGYNSIPTHADVSVHVQTAATVIMKDVSPYCGVVSTVTGVYSVFIHRTITFAVFYEEIVEKPVNIPQFPLS